MRIRKADVSRHEAKHLPRYNGIKKEGDYREYVQLRVRERIRSNEDCQMIVLVDAGVNKKNIYVDKQSEKDFNHPQYKRQEEDIAAAKDRGAASDDPCVKFWQIARIL